ncbi:SgcJ/EcaC family oxidoreductase [Catellatospora sp. KI3]|uniref:YybH family protein n=1 Tax=Catellatospora sp. KI3 TaxID=3041620 RepID=UPI002482451D|nr:SgcJ/EcaC family oxidoreductase [Catellatospora sp. KI3]MDI1462525.1 SgcJ/EcaC family oxidoreductase [Catellatospora sp. KI3]
MADEDLAAIGDVMRRLGTAFATLSADGVADLYTADADWTNAFGTSRRGGPEIAAYLADLFADRHFAAGRPLGPPQADIRLLTPEVAVVKTYLERAGQQTSDGAAMPVRRNFSLKVLTRRPDGWRIASDIYMDARDDTTLGG